MGVVDVDVDVDDDDDDDDDDVVVVVVVQYGTEIDISLTMLLTNSFRIMHQRVNIIKYYLNHLRNLVYVPSTHSRKRHSHSMSLTFFLELFCSLDMSSFIWHQFDDHRCQHIHVCAAGSLFV